MFLRRLRFLAAKQNLPQRVAEVTKGCPGLAKREHAQSTFATYSVHDFVSGQVLSDDVVNHVTEVLLQPLV